MHNLIYTSAIALIVHSIDIASLLDLSSVRLFTPDEQKHHDIRSISSIIIITKIIPNSQKKLHVTKLCKTFVPLEKQASAEKPWTRDARSDKPWGKKSLLLRRRMPTSSATPRRDKSQQGGVKTTRKRSIERVVRVALRSAPRARVSVYQATKWISSPRGDETERERKSCALLTWEYAKRIKRRRYEGVLHVRHLLRLNAGSL